MENKLKTFSIEYNFRGYGTIEIKAKNKEQAEDIFDERDWENDNEWSEDTSIYSIEEVKQIKQ